MTVDIHGYFPDHDLKAIYNFLNRRYFDNKVTASIRWGNPNQKKRRNSILWGHYDPKQNEIVINVLHKEAPAWFLAATIHHEMVHELVPVYINPRNGRRVIHGPEFKRKDKLFPYHKEAKTWSKNNIHKFITKGKPTSHTPSVTVQQHNSMKSYQHNSMKSYQGFSIGQVVYQGNHAFKIIEFKPRSYKYPIIGLCLRSHKRYKLSKASLSITKIKPKAAKISQIEIGAIVKTVSGKIYEIVAFKPRNWKNPIIGRRLSDNKRFKFGKEKIVEILGRSV